MSADEAQPDALPDYERSPELALVATLELVTRYTSTGNPRLADAAVRQLRVIARDARLPDAVRHCAAGIVGDWQMLACGRPAHATPH